VSHAELDPAAVAIAPGTMRLYAIDLRVRDVAALTDLPTVRGLLYEAAEAGRASVLGEEFVTFPNGALTGVLVLAQSHLSIHTWPELRLANVDLLTYGSLSADPIVAVLERGLDVEAVERTCVVRGVPG
jgi:S-adenosylmethionine decarboxylase